MVEQIAAVLTPFLAATGTLGIFIGMLLESACIPIPSEVVLPFAGIMVTQGICSFWAAVAWAMAGQMGGSALSYYAGTHGGRSFVERYGKYVLLRKHDFELVDRWFLKYGGITAVVTRMLPGVRTFISLSAGIAKMPFARFMAFSFLGALPWTIFLIWAGYEVGTVWQDPQWHPYFRMAGLAVAVACGALLLVYILKRRGTSTSADPSSNAQNG